MQSSELELGGHTYEKYLYRDGLINLKTWLTRVFSTLPLKLITNVRFSSYGFLQDELEGIMKVWHQHRIRRIRMFEGSNRVPDVIYFLPNRYVKENRRDEVEDADLLLSREFLSEPLYYGCSNDFAELACIIINELLTCQSSYTKRKGKRRTVLFSNKGWNNQFTLMIIFLHNGVLRYFCSNRNLMNCKPPLHLGVQAIFLLEEYFAFDEWFERNYFLWDEIRVLLWVFIKTTWQFLFADISFGMLALVLLL